MKLTQIALTALISAAIAFGVAKYAAPTTQVEAKKETRLDQIKRTGVLRCGYFQWPTITEKDPNTGKMSGLSVDLLEQIGKQLSLKIEWTTEITIPNVPTDLANGRYDVVCSPFYATPSRAREMDFTAPVMFHPAYLYVRTDDMRFENNYAAANDPSVKFSTIDGDFSFIAAEENFPKSAKAALPQTASGSEIFLNIATQKADVVVTEPVAYTMFNKTNSGLVRRVAGPPVRVMPVGFPIPMDEMALKHALDTTISNIQGSGMLDALFDKYEPKDAKFLRLPKPYMMPQEGNSP